MSRKNQFNQKITALYCRISLDDGSQNESMSISNQKLMLKDYAEKIGLSRYEYYVDDGYTGRNFNRPSFKRLISDIEAGKVGCVITKDLSRLGRNYIEAGSYIEIFFPKHNVRYIAVTDGVDSLTRQEMDITPFKNILNDMYSRDISKKVLAGRMTRSRQGKFCGGQPPLGLMRDPEDGGHLVLDPETAPIIRKIYDLALNGWGCMRIAKRLMEDKIPITRVKRIRIVTPIIIHGAAQESAISCEIPFTRAHIWYAGHTRKGFVPTPMTSFHGRNGRSWKAAMKRLYPRRTGKRCRNSLTAARPLWRGTPARFITCSTALFTVPPAENPCRYGMRR